MTRKAIFKFSQSFDHNLHVDIEEVIFFPMTITMDQCFLQLIHNHNIPSIAHEAFRVKLGSFIDQENYLEFKSYYGRLLEEFHSGSFDINKIFSYFDQSSKNNSSEIDQVSQVSDEEIFSHAYRQMIHSPAAKDLIQLERSFAIAVASELDKRNIILNEMEQKHIKETEMGLQMRGFDVPETITHLQENYYQSREIIESQWNSCISELKLEQRRALREFVMSFGEQLAIISTRGDKKCTNKSPTDDTSISNTKSLPDNSNTTFRNSTNKPEQIDSVSNMSIPWSETFTVQLGRQHRAICNFRLIQLDPVDLLRNIGFNLQYNHNSADDLAQRMSNALSIYSDNLHGLVILVDKHISSHRGIKKHLATACERSTEFHFPELESQLASIQDTINKIGPRNRSPCLINESKQHNESTVKIPKSANLEPIHGDVYITKHSNLVGDVGIGGINVIFHLVVDEEVDDSIRAPSPLHCAVSAIIKTCFNYDIRSLSLPLLLTPQLHENMNQSWRVKRAETVLKTVKGSLMELITWRGPTLQSIQFLAPSCLEAKELASFGELISNSFLQPNPLIATY